MATSSQGQAGQQQQGPPYASRDAALGGLPTTTVDIPISAVLIVVFICSAAINMTVLQLNRRRGHKFIMSGLLFGFSMARITANVMRIVWACYPHNVRIALASSILTNAGVLLLFIINLNLSQRLLRSYQPRLGWSKPLKMIFTFLYVCVVLSLVMVIVAIIYNAYTLNTHIKAQLRDVQLTAVTFMAILSFLPIPITLMAVLLPQKEPVDKFGEGSSRTKIFVVLFTSVLLAFGASFRAGIQFMRRPITSPAWFHHKALFYCIYFLIEVIVVFSYPLCRFDRRFHIPNGSSGPGDYSRAAANQGDATRRETTDEESLGEAKTQRAEDLEGQKEREWESNAQKELNTRAAA